MVIAFHTKDPDGVVEALNIFLFPDLSPLAGLEAALLKSKWEAILGDRNLTSFAETSLMMGNQKVVPITGWDKGASQLEAWAVFCTVFLGDETKHPMTHKMFLLIEETSGVSLRLQAQARQQPTFPAALLYLIQKDFNESLWQALDMWQRVQWKDFESLRRFLKTGNFRLELVALLGGIATPE